MYRVLGRGAHVVDEGGALFAKVAVHRGRFDPSAPWQHWMQPWTVRG